MAYVETDGRSGINPGGFAATLLLNGALIAVIATYAPTGATKIADWFPGAVTLTPDLPPPPPPETVKERPKSKPAPFTPPVAYAGPAQSANPIRAETLPLTPPPLPPTPGTGIVDPPPLPPVHTPVRVAPKFDPRFAASVQPAYPPGKARNEEEGSVTVRVLVGPDGRVRQVEPVGNADPEFFESTRRQALAKWRFKPATLDGDPVEGWREMTVHFRMDR